MALGLCTTDAAAAAKKKSQTKTSAASKGKKAPRETSASVKKQEQSINQEIRLTQTQIEENEAAVKENLAILTNLEHDIELQNKKITDLQNNQQTITADITKCGEQIKDCEDHLGKLREQYINAVKKMRIARKKANPLAYIFASKNFYQAWRRIRYMQKFNEWRARREKEIKGEVARLGELQKQLSSKQTELQTNLSDQKQAQKELAAKHTAQDEAVKTLRQHGDALRQHLAQKQAEANALSAKVMQLIAAEQEEARLAQERAAKAAAEKKAAEEKAAKEKAAKEKAAAEKKAAEEKAAAEKKEAEEKAAKEKAAKEKKDKDKKKKEDKKAADKKTETKPADKAAESKGGQSTDYANARNRTPRKNDNAAPAPTSKPSPAPAPASTPAPAPVSTGTVATGFAAAKGSLPRPVSGRFSIVSRFGRHALPDLPDVMFDNPGIDAVVDAGASAQAVYDGVVTGVYVLPGFSTVVIVSHGEYYTVYGNIGTPSVAKGETVKQGQALGRLVSDPDEGGRTTIHFEVYKNREKLNPEAWIK